MSRKAEVRALPRISQFLDMPLKSWQSRSCGIAALATVIGYWNREAPDLKKLRREAIAIGAYQPSVGWRHKELAMLAGHYQLSGKNYDWASQAPAAAWKRCKSALARGPVIASIHKDFKADQGGHLIVVNRISRGTVFYHEPAARTRRGIPRRISLAKFRNGWKRRIIAVRPR